MSNGKLSRLGSGIVFASLSVTARAEPLLYQCRLVDYTETGAETLEFQYWQVGESRTFHSAHSDARIYLDDDRRLVLSLRPAASAGEQPASYATATGYGLPQRLNLVLSNGNIDGYASRLECIF